MLQRTAKQVVAEKPGKRGRDRNTGHEPEQLPLPGDEPPGPTTAARLAHLYGRVGLKLRRCNQISIALFEQAIGESKLTSSQYGAMVVLKEFPGINQMRLGRLLGYDRSTIGSIVNHLEIRGLIDRRADPNDGRGRTLTLTPAAEEVMARGLAASLISQQKLLEPLTGEQRGALIDALDTILDAYNSTTRAPIEESKERDLIK